MKPTKIKRRIAVLLALLLFMPQLPVKAAEDVSAGGGIAEEVSYNTGSHSYRVAEAPEEKEDFDVSGSNSVSEGNVEIGISWADDYFNSDGSYTIHIPELNPFFPYEVQFTCDGQVTNEWFMTPEDSVVVGGHTFHVSADFDNTAVTQMSFNVAGKKVIVYPERKEFTENGGIALMSLLPLEEVSLTMDLTGFTPLDLSMVSVDEICLGAGIPLAEPDKLIWSYNTYTYDDDFTVSEKGQTINLNRCSSGIQMIVGEADQLAADNIRYIVRWKQLPDIGEWLTPCLCGESKDGSRTQIDVLDTRAYCYSDEYYADYYISIREEYSDYYAFSTVGKVCFGLTVNTDLYENAGYTTLKVYEGIAHTAEEAMKNQEVTSQILNPDLEQAGSGFAISWHAYGGSLAIVGFDEAGNIVGFLPIQYHVNLASQGIYSVFLEKRSENGNSIFVDDAWTYSNTEADGWEMYTYELYKGYAANDTYYRTCVYYVDGVSSGDKITAAYAGKFASIAEAVEAGAVDIKDQLFGIGYPADYSQGVYFTVFVGEDGSEDQKIYRWGEKTVEGDIENPSSAPTASSSAYLSFYGLYNADGYTVGSYCVESGDDTLGRNSNFVTLLVGPDADITKLAPYFYSSLNAKVYTAGSSEPERSGETYHDFSKGPIQYTVSAEDGENAQNYWLHVVQPTEGTGWLYLNSLYDPDAEVTRDADGTVHAVREIVLDGYEGYTHDILLANMGTEAISSLGVELVSDSVSLDEYWTLTGKHELAGFSGTATKDSEGNYVSYGELPNLAKLRLKAKEGVKNGTEVSGTLTIKSGDKALVVLELKGLIGDPSIITEEIPHAVKYVPYGTMIQNSNRYDWNRVTYYWGGGELPDGMTVRPNGEIYGVPVEAGEYTFTVTMSNSYSGFSSDYKTFTLVVDENTDENVDGATDEGYNLTERVQNMYMDSMPTADQLLVSEGVLGEFVDLYLDGVCLIPQEQYTAESGSTRITIAAETLSSLNVGTHTLGMEFRTGDSDLLKRAAQNFTIEEKKPTPPPSNPGNTEGSAGGSTDNAGSSAGSAGGCTDNAGSNTGNTASSAGNTGDAASQADDSTGDVEESAGIPLPEEQSEVPALTTTLYTVQAGDSLWKIAAKFFGDGSYWQKIYEDNRDVIANPDRIYKGQVLKIVTGTGEAEGEAETVQPVSEENVYVVQRGDSLWKIAKKELGLGQLWTVIYDANRDKIADSKRIYAGQKLIIPKG